MKYKSPAISLTYIKHGESSIISKVFTKEKGLQTFIIKGVRSKKSKKKISYFEPLKLLNIDAIFNEKKSLQYLGDVNIAANADNKKNKLYTHFIAFFVAEVTSKVLQENEQNTMLFDFVWNTGNSLYNSEEKDLNFPVKYLLNLSHFLGFYPSMLDIQKPFFELEEGRFSDKINPQKTYLDKDQSIYLKALLENDKLVMTKEKKSSLLKALILYYKLHHYNLDSITSHLVIEALKQ